jgi:hypothetical protein
MRSEPSAPTSPAKSTRMDFSTFHSKYCMSNHRLSSSYGIRLVERFEQRLEQSFQSRAGIVPRIKTFTWDTRARRPMPLRNYVTRLLLKYAQTQRRKDREERREREGIRSRSREMDETVSDWRYHVAQVRAINQDKLMINKLVSALRCPFPPHCLSYISVQITGRLPKPTVG